MKTSLLLALAFSTAVLAQSQSEMNLEAAREAERADKELNKVYKQVLVSLDDEGAKLLKASQRAWISFRDAEAAFAADEARGGSMAPMLYSGTLGRLTEQRTEMLRQRLGEDAKTEAPAPKAKPIAKPPAPRAEPVTEPSEPKPAPTPSPRATGSEPPGAKSQSLAAQQFFDAYKAHDRKTAENVATEVALKKLIWKTSAGDNPTLKLMDNTHIYYEGGSIELKMQQTASGRWFVADVTLYAD